MKQYVKFKLNPGQSPPADGFCKGFVLDEDWLVWIGTYGQFPLTDPTSNSPYNYAVMTEEEINDFYEVSYPSVYYEVVTGGTGGSGGTAYTGGTGGTAGIGDMYTFDLAVNPINAFASNPWPHIDYSEDKAFDNDLKTFFISVTTEDVTQSKNVQYVGYKFLKTACIDPNKAFSFGDYDSTGTYDPSNAFDDDYDTHWRSNKTTTDKTFDRGIGYQFDVEKVIRSIMIKQLASTNIPQDFEIYGSDFTPLSITDGRCLAHFHYEWETYDTYKIFNFNNEIAFKYYWLRCDNRYISSSNYYCSIESIRMSENHNDFNFVNINRLKLYCGKYPELTPNKFRLRGGYYPPKAINDGTLIKSFDHTDDLDFWAENDVKEFLIKENTHRFPFYWIDMQEISANLGNVNVYYISDFEMEEAQYTENLANTDNLNVFSFNGEENDRNNIFNDNPDSEFSSPFPGFIGVELLHSEHKSDYSGYTIQSTQMTEHPTTLVQYDDDRVWRSKNSTGDHIGHYFHVPKLINKVRIRCNSISNAPFNFQIRAGDSSVTPSETTGVLLLSVDVRDNIKSFWPRNQYKDFEFPNHIPYQKYWIQLLSKDVTNPVIYDYEIAQIDWMYEERSYPISKSYNVTTSDVSQIDLTGIDDFKLARISKRLINDQVSLSWLFSTDGRNSWKKLSLIDPYVFLIGDYSRILAIKNGPTNYQFWCDNESTHKVNYITSFDTYTFETEEEQTHIGLNPNGYDSSRSKNRHIIKESDTSYKMWYSGFDGNYWRILYSTSVDGINWEDSVQSFKVNVLVDYSIVYIHSPFVLKESDTSYKMWFTGYNGGKNIIFYCDSTDGITWTNFTKCIDSISQDTYFYNGVDNANVIKEGPNEYRMYVDGLTNNVTRIIHFTSSDGINWAFDQVIIDTHVSNDINRIHLSVNCIIKDEEGLYRLWYSNYETSWEILYVESSDGINFLTPHVQLVKLDEIINDNYSTDVPSNYSLMSSDRLESVIPMLDLTSEDTLDFFTLLDSVHHNVSPIVEDVKLSKNVIEWKFDEDNTDFDSTDLEAAAIQWRQLNTDIVQLNQYCEVTSVSGLLTVSSIVNSTSVTHPKEYSPDTANAYFELPAGAFVTSWTASMSDKCSLTFYNQEDGNTFSTSAISSHNNYTVSSFRIYVTWYYGSTNYLRYFIFYGYMPSAVYYLALCKLRKTAYLVNSPAIVFTSSDGQIDISVVSLISTFVLSYDLHSYGVISCLISLDNKQTWKRYNTITELWESAALENTSNWNDISELTTGMTNFDSTDYDTLDFVFSLSTTNSEYTPEIYSVTINGSIILNFDRSYNVECLTKIDNPIEIRNSGCRSCPVVPASQYSDNLATVTANSFGINFTNTTYCFDNNLSTEGYSNTRSMALVGYHFPNRYCITKLSMIVKTTDFGPNHFQIRAGDTQPTTFGEGVLLLEVDESLNDYWLSGVVKDFEFDNNGFYEYYWVECLNKFGNYGLETYEYRICEIMMYSFINEYYVTYNPLMTYNNINIQTSETSQFDLSLIDIIDTIKFDYLRPEYSDIRILFSFDGKQNWYKYETHCDWIPIMRDIRMFEGGILGRGNYGKSIIKESDTSYKMWCTTTIGRKYYIATLVSNNGIDWTHLQNCFGTHGDYDSSQFGYPCVIKESDTSYKMWYSGFNGDYWQILYLTSEDGVNWSTYSLQIVYNVLDPYATHDVKFPWVIKESDTSYKMWYSGKDSSGVWRILYTTSVDGINWENHQLVLDIGLHKEIDTTNLYYPKVVYSESDSKYIMFYYATSDLDFIGTATSADGINWTIVDDNSTNYYSDLFSDIDNYIPPHSHSLNFSRTSAKIYPDCIIKDGDIYKIWGSLIDSYSYQSFYKTIKNFDDFHSQHYVKHNISDCLRGNTIEEIEELFTNYDSSQLSTLDLAFVMTTKDYLVSPTIKSINLYYSSEVIEYDDPTKIIQEDSEIGTAIVNNKLQLKNFESGIFLCDDVVFSNDISINTGSLYNLFEDTIGTYAGNNSLQVSEYPVQITYDFGEYLTRAIDRYIISIPTDAFNVLYYPTDWTFEGSNNGVDWDVLDTQTSFTTWMLNGANTEFKVTNSTNYRYYRWVFTSGPSSICSLSKLKLFINEHVSRIITKISLTCYDSPTLMPNYFHVRAGDSVPNGIGQGILLREFDFRQFPGYWSSNEIKSFFIGHADRYSHYWLDVYSVEDINVSSFTIGKLQLYANGPDVIATGGTGGTGGSA